MAHDLALCPRCARHVKADAARCPFCDAAVTTPPTRELPTGLSRGALVALGATLALADCRATGNDTSIAQPYGAPPIRTPDVPLIMAPYGAPPDRRPEVPPPTNVVASDIAWELTASASTVSMAARASWRMNVLATNRGTTAVDPERGQLTFLVNGRPSMAANLAFGNGAMEHAWLSLPPGATARDARELGPGLFEAPGDYEITLQRRGATVASLRVRVVP